MSDSDDDGSVPPDAQGEAVNAANLPQAAGGDADLEGAGGGATPQHPVWAAAAGRGGGAHKSKHDSMYKPISMMELEIRGRGDLDGGSSTASVRGDKDIKERQRKGGGGERKKRGRPREYDDKDDDDDVDNADGGESSASLDMAGAAFGGTTAAKGRATCMAEESEDGASVTSSVARRRHERAFPITGVTCVGCALPAKITPVADFIAKNMSSMAEMALFKMAALIYKTKVAEPAEEEGVDVPEWGAHMPSKDTHLASAARSHRLHCACQTGRKSVHISSCTRSTQGCIGMKISELSPPCARHWRCSCCVATLRPVRIHSISTTRRPS